MVNEPGWISVPRTGDPLTLLGLQRWLQVALQQVSIVTKRYCFHDDELIRMLDCVERALEAQGIGPDAE